MNIGWFFLIAAFVVYLVIGGFISNWYMKKVDGIFQVKHGFHRHEAAIGVVGGLMLIGWVFFLPLELITNFRRWE